MKKYFLITILLMLTIAFANARPQYSILQNFGTKCIGCHYNTQGGGARTQPGWMARKDISLINPGTIGLQGLYDAMETNTVFNEVATFGVDFRLQSARWGPPIGRDMMVMQLSPFIILQPFNWLGFEGFYNIAYDIASDKRFVGQNPYSASMYIKPSEKLPSLRVGYFQPTIGTKYDDHTMLIREVTGIWKGQTRPLIPGDYAEFGAQIDYEALDWVGLSVGMFDTKNMIKLTTKSKANTTIPVVDTGSVSTVLRAFITPPNIIDGVTTFFGGTYLLNDDYYISSVFFNIGLTEQLALMTEYMRSEKKDSRLTLNFLAEVTYAVTDAVLPFVRAERGVTKYKVENHPFYTNQFVFGAHVNLLPYIDLLPEYRIYNSEQVPGYSAEWTFQLHIFY
ncbi:MAG: hypothetical protein A2X61_12455 [Ignavibacteria bacterium GWB2_35_12]|nr:MAG: hypothetical protein A2X63_07495 [Ignavibacteria bacterium GWA2_35_8]OGU41601.1 MAG: hypothetical protein A2X61_12455 [Ignavibacteria bacterium GWB2_35_12]OGU97219.1 MAG: hypothetical protein A2220_06095 [Ignavibacteria bacterium RIFOXYA2_FULL_35_10]OGV24934.1 MAG: hypothetical protein A2475_16300 [Ignavibacteria bacterium RIFOXYC2_FULL_35_21]